jgi:hypothetical protein
MLARLIKFVSNNPLAATIVGTIIGGWVLTQLLAMKAPDVGGVVGTIGRWLRTPAGSTRADIITLTAVSILLGFVGFAAILLGQYQKLRRRPNDSPLVPALVPAAAPVPPPPKELVLADFDNNQQQILVMLLRIYPRSIALRALLENFQVTYPAGEILAESVEKLGLVTITPAYYDAKSIALTKQGRDFCCKVGLDLIT